uniref:Calmodulin n=1 Tax=Mesocestoides corti TaxID=53468 RepID=A0A5K3EFG6_MESCO
AFQLFDKSGEGFFTTESLRELLREGENETLTNEDIDALCRHADTDGDGKVYFSDFVRVMLSS